MEGTRGHNVKWYRSSTERQAFHDLILSGVWENDDHRADLVNEKHAGLSSSANLSNFTLLSRDIQQL